MLLCSLTLMRHAQALDVAGEVRPEQFCSETGCPEGTEPWDDIFRAMLTSEVCMPDRYGHLRIRGENTFRTSCTVRLSCRHYHFARRLEVPRATYFMGCGHGDGNLPTQLRFTCDTAGVWLPGWDSGEGRYNGTIEGVHLGAGAVFERVQVAPTSKRCPLTRDSDAHGFTVAGRVWLNRVIVYGMQGAGLHISTPNGGNPSLTSIHGFEALHNGGRCIDIPEGNPGDSSNSNQILLQETNCTGNCRAYTEGGRYATSDCQELREQSKLGNVYIAMHINNALVPNILSDRPSARSSAFYLYVEDGFSSVPSTITNWDLFGGQGEPLRGSAWGRFGGLSVGHSQWRTPIDRQARKYDYVRIGGERNFAPNALFGVQGADQSRFTLSRRGSAFRWKTGLTSEWAMTVDQNEVQIPRLRIGGGHAAQGSDSAVNLITVDDCANPPSPLNWPRGTVAMCTNVTPGGPGMLIRCGNGAWCTLVAEPE